MTERAFKLTLILLALVGLLLAFQGRSWAGIWVAYDSNPMVVFDGADCAGGVTEAIKQNPNARIVFESVGGGTAESTIGAWTGAASGVSECLSNPDFNAGVTGWIETNGTISSVAGGQSGNCMQLERTAMTYQYALSNAFATTVGRLYQYSSWLKAGTSGNEAAWFQFKNPGAVVLSVLQETASGAWVKYTGYATANTATSYLFNVKYSGTAGTMLFDECSVSPLDAPGPNGCFLGPVTVRGNFDANKITKFQILRPVFGREQARTRTEDWEVVYDSSVI